MATSSDSMLFSPSQGPPPLVVEESRQQREQMVDALNKAGYLARQAADRQEALREALSGNIAVVIMNKVLHDEIDLAQEIQRLHPHSSFIFTCRHLSRADWSRLRVLHVHVEGAIEKPVAAHWQELVRLVEKALIKVQVRERLESIEERHLDPLTYLHALADLASFPKVIFDELVRELTAADEDAPGEDEGSPMSWDFESSPDLQGVGAEIDEIYRRLRALVKAGQGDPKLAAEAQPLRRRLRELQEREADAMERRFRQGLRFDAEKAERNLDLAERLLGRA